MATGVEWREICIMSPHSSDGTESTEAKVSCYPSLR